MFVSWAQNFEDVYLHRCFADRTDGMWIDVGAWLPDIDSVTKVLSDRGWRGINIEPVPTFFEQLASARPHDINLQCAVGDTSGTALIHHVPHTGLSTTRRDFADRAAVERQVTTIEIEVPQQTLNDIWEEHVADKQEVQVLKIDVEGSEDEVLAGIDLQSHRPWVIIVESNLPDTRIQSYDWEPRLTASSYAHVLYDGLNRWYVAKEHEDLAQHFTVPVCLFDHVVRFNHVQREHELTAQLDRQHVANEQLRRTIDELRSSTSWKITSPMRTASRALAARLDAGKPGSTKLGPGKGTA
jgi:FkbM family methyltransferase